MDLKRLSNQQLFSVLQLAAAVEREATIELLRYLREVEARQLHLEMGYSSLFALCTEALGYSEDAAQARILAMRLTRAVPRVEAKLESGELSLAVAASIGASFRREEREGRAVLEKERIVESLVNASARQAERILATEFPRAAPREREKAISASHTKIEFVADAELLAKLRRLKELLAHKNFDGRYDALFQELADIALRKLEPRSSEGKATKPERQEPSDNAMPHGTSRVGRPKAPEIRSRYIPLANRRAVLARNGCEYVDPSTRHRCGSRHGLQVDHVHPYSLGGTNDLENLRALCGAHNRWLYRNSS